MRALTKHHGDLQVLVFPLQFDPGAVRIDQRIREIVDVVLCDPYVQVLEGFAIPIDKSVQDAVVDQRFQIYFQDHQIT